MAEKESKKTGKIEREYVIPLREKCRPVPRYKKTPKAIKSIKEFLVRHMKIRDRDLKKIKIDSYLNEQIWMRGIKKPMHKVKVKVVKDGDFVRVYSADLPKRINFRKLREEKKEIEDKAMAEKQKTLLEKAKESFKGKKGEEKSTKEKPEEELKEESKEKSGRESGSEKLVEEKQEDKTEGEEEKKEEIEKEKATRDISEKQEKEAKRKKKHTTKPKSSKQLKSERVGYNQTSRGH